MSRARSGRRSCWRSCSRCSPRSYAELVTKYPQAASAALYVNRAWRRPIVTFMVAFAVMCSGLTSAATLSRAVGSDYLSEFVDAPTVLVGLVSSHWWRS